jgi:hypothetical protein
MPNPKDIFPSLKDLRWWSCLKYFLVGFLFILQFIYITLLAIL